MSGTQPPPRFHIDQPDTIPNGVRADLGRAFDRQTRKVGRAYRLVVYTPDERQPHLVYPMSAVLTSITDPVTLTVGVGRFIALDDPRLYPLVGIAIQGDRLEAIKRARVGFDLGLAEAKSLIESVLNEGAERGPITGVTLKDGRTVVVRQQDDDAAKEREGWSFTSGFPDSGGDDALALDLREKGIEIRTMRATDELRAKDMDEAMADVFRGANLRPGNTLHVVTGSTDKPKSQIIGADDFRDAMIDWLLNPSAEKYEKLRQAGIACGLNPDEQIKAANERAQAATAEAVQMSAAAREANATLGRVMHALRGVVAFPDVQHTADPELPPEVRETLDKVLELVARRAKDT